MDSDHQEGLYTGNDSDDDNYGTNDDTLADPLLPETLNTLLQIDHSIHDCLFVGKYSKHVFRRKETEDNLAIRLCLEQELSLYINFHLLPLLTDILSTDARRHNYYIWIAIENRFEKAMETETKITRWSSLRNK